MTHHLRDTAAELEDCEHNESTSIPLNTDKPRTKESDDCGEPVETIPAPYTATAERHRSVNQRDETDINDYESVLILNLYKQKFYSEAFERSLQVVKSGDKRCHYLHSLMLYHGHGCAEDRTQARIYAHLAEAKGHARSQAFYGLMLLHGDGGDRRLTLAKYYLTLSLENGYKKAENLLKKYFN